MLKIEKGVPIAPSYREKSKSKWAALDTMDIGDSFEMEVPKGKDGYRRVYNSVWVAFHNRKLRCLIRRIDEKTIRVWRVSKYEKKNAKLMAVS